jgi:ribosome biogenesis protein BMS1
MEADERKKLTFIQALNTIRNEKVTKRKAKNVEKRVERAKQAAKEDEKMSVIRKANKKRQFRSEGKMDAARESKRMRGE